MSEEQPRAIIAGRAKGPVISTREALSFWGGINPANGEVIDIHHPLHGQSITGKILLMPTSRGSCTGSGVLLDLILAGRGPAALVFTEAEDVLTLGAVVAAQMFDRPLLVLRVPRALFSDIAAATEAEISPEALSFGDRKHALAAAPGNRLALTVDDQAMLDGERGKAVQQAMRIIATMAVEQGASRLIDVSRVHIDGCIYASPANLVFAETFADMGAQVVIPATMNAISVDRQNWERQGVPVAFGAPAARLADAYVRMGCQPTFTCSPYLLDSAPTRGETIAWSESNAVIFANSILGARTTKHPDFLDLCIALTGRAPEAGVYLSENRRPRRVIDIDMPQDADDSFWPLIGYLAGKKAPDCIPLLRGIAGGKPSRDDLKALCAAFGTTSGAPLLHIAGVTPEADLPPHRAADLVSITAADMREAWMLLQDGPEEIDLVAIGSPHASLQECLALEAVLAEAGAEQLNSEVSIIVTAGRQVIAELEETGVLARLRAKRVQVLPDLCWCSISEPVFPPRARAVMTNSGKYAHYGPGLSGRAVRFGSLADCVEAAVKGRVPRRLPAWLG